MAIGLVLLVPEFHASGWLERWSPSMTAHVRLLGSWQEGYAPGALVRWGFIEAGGDSEAGVTAGFRAGRFVLDGNLVDGLGIEEDEMGEVTER
jgi:hypothetical protein